MNYLSSTVDRVIGAGAVDERLKLALSSEKFGQTLYARENDANGGLCMQWDAFGAVAEMVGSAAVIFTLVYLVAQMRQNSNIAAAESVREITRYWDEALQDMIRNNPTMLPALGNLAAVDDEVRFAALSRMARLIQAHGMIWQQFKLGVMPAQNIAIADQALASVLKTPGGSVYWAASKQFWPHPEHVDEMLAAYEGPSWIEFFEDLGRRVGA